jgi:micrococcal nuclease
MSKYGYDGSKPVAITFIPIYRRLPYVKIGSSLPISKRGLKHTAVCLLAFLPLLFFAATSSIGADYYLVTRAVDGDTIVLATKDRVRLIGVDTPELHHPRKPVQYYGEEAYRFTQKIVEGKTVRLEYDWQRRDRYGRLLAYVYLPDGTFLNSELIRQGYGHAYTKYPFKYLDEFRKLEREARETGKGLWK